jgi:hypothetical protein
MARYFLHLRDGTDETPDAEDSAPCSARAEWRRHHSRRGSRPQLSPTVIFGYQAFWSE